MLAAAPRLCAACQNLAFMSVCGGLSHLFHRSSQAADRLYPTKLLQTAELACSAIPAHSLIPAPWLLLQIDLWAEGAADAAVAVIKLPPGCYNGETVFVPR